jgi:hypothetical protein
MFKKVFRYRALIKKILPKTLIAKIQVILMKRRNLLYENLTVKEIFSDIYQKGIWGISQDSTQPFFSGTGSQDKAITNIYVENVRTFLQSFDVKPCVVDLGCGDFSIGSQIRSMCGVYIACDIVPELINFNLKKYQHLDVDFRELDLISQELPSGDIVFIRQVLQHLSNQQIAKLIPKLRPNFKYLVLTEHLPNHHNFLPNIDKPVGPDVRLEMGSGVVLTTHPFNLYVSNERILCEVNESGGLIRTTIYEL